ncbi:hypothetical protein CROQUDRAFT_44349 [Cronartium quercuum f. sp. fusiforme G11]|uniref:Uncharacterized protein n=1 Tax=Cronartium quercuum f. sp. fusiforme G11 TaxID=708437 RepID=A0A9P6NIC2_9BASI|nr:hypothetical protein CROQUDRAFT_44349 [Cronartium quercuum f. sp. fusiforme G11]
MPYSMLPKAFHPPTQSTIAVNKLKQPTFPYARLDALPDLSYAFENLLVSFLTLITSLLDYVFTLFVWIPLGLLRTISEGVVDPLSRYFTQDPPRISITTPPRVVVISGGSSGIGANLVQAYACSQTALVILGRDEDRLSQIAKVAKSLGCTTVETFSIDYAHEAAEDAIKTVLLNTRERYGVIDEVFAVTGTVTFTDDQHGQPQKWGANTAKRLNTVNVMSTYTFIMQSWEIMMMQKSGKICIISSSAALFGPPQFAVYGATKANLFSLSQSLRALSTPYGVRVSCICPGFIESGMTADMLAAGSTMPAAMLADTSQMADRIRRAVQKEQAVVLWPLNQVLPLMMASRLNWLNADIGRWVASKIGVTGHMVS